MSYSDMKATKTDKSDNIKDALGKLVDGLSQGSKKSGRKKSNSSKKSSSTKRTNSNSTTARKTSSGSRKKSTTASAIGKATKIVVDSKSSSKKSKTLNVKAAKTNMVFILGIVMLVVGIAMGLGVSHFMFGSDTYEMVSYQNGSIDITIGKEEDDTIYKEMGVKCIAFGKDRSKEYTVTYYYRDDLSSDPVEVERVDETKEGIYYAVYKSPSKKFSTVKLIRNIIVIGEEDNGQI